MSLFIANRLLIECLKKEEDIKFDFKVTVFEGNPMAIVSKTDKTRSNPEFKNILELVTSMKL